MADARKSRASGEEICFEGKTYPPTFRFSGKSLSGVNGGERRGHIDQSKISPFYPGEQTQRTTRSRPSSLALCLTMNACNVLFYFLFV